MKNLLVALAALPLVSFGARAAVYTYTPGGSDNLFTNPANWSNGTTTGTAYPSTTADTANIGLASGNQTVVYDASGTGTFGTLNMSNTGTGSNVFDSQRGVGGTLTLANGFALGSATGTNTVIVDALAPQNTGFSQSLSVGAANTVTLNAGGVLEYHPFVSNASNAGALLTGNLAIAGGTFNIDQAQVVSGSTQGSAQSNVNGSLSMSSGALVIGRVITPGTTGGTNNLTIFDNRLLVSGNLNVTGGSISVAAGNGTVAATNNANLGSISFGGATNVITGLAAGSNLSAITLTASRNDNSSLTTDQVLFNLVERFSVAGKTLTVTNTNTATTGNIRQLQFAGGTGVGSSATVVLGSNLTAINGAGANAIAATNTGYSGTGSASFTVDLAGYTYDLRNTGTAYAPTNPSANVLASIAFNSSTGNGLLRATGFNLSLLGGTPSGASTGVTGSSVGPNVTLESTGGNGTVNNLSVAATSTGTISASSTFRYSGTAAAGPVAGGNTGTEASLISNRTVGILSVTIGALNVNQANLNIAGGVNLSSAGKLDIYGTDYGALTLTAGNFTAANSTLELTLGGANDAIIGSGAGQSFSLTNVTIAINGSASQSSYQVFSGFNGANTVNGITFTGAPAGMSASLDTNGFITFAAVPEPSTWVCGLGCLALLVRRKHYQRLANTFGAWRA